MKIRMLTIGAGPAGTWAQGAIRDVPAAEGVTAVADGWAVAVGEMPAGEMPAGLPKRETATAPVAGVVKRKRKRTE